MARPHHREHFCEKRMAVRLFSPNYSRKMGKITEKKFLQFIEGYGILKNVVEEIGGSLL